MWKILDSILQVKDFIPSNSNVGNVLGPAVGVLGGLKVARSILERSRGTDIRYLPSDRHMTDDELRKYIANFVSQAQANETAASIATDTPRGVFDGVTGMCEASTAGEAALQVQTTGLTDDALDGLGGGGKTNSVKITVMAAAAVGGAALAWYGYKRAYARTVEDQIMNNQGNSGTTGNTSSGTSSTAQHNTGSTGSSGQAPGAGGNQPPRRNSRSRSTTQLQSWIFEAFLNLFGVQSLDDVTIRGQRIFRGLQDHQKRTLENLIVNNFNDLESLTRLVETITNIFNTFDIEDVNFLNFVSLTEFIIVFVAEAAELRNAQQQASQRSSPGTYSSRRQQLITIANAQIHQHDYTISRVFREISLQVARQTLPIDFRDIFAAVYHYFKHRNDPGTELSVEEYFQLIRDAEVVIVRSPQYPSGRTVIFERYDARYSRRLRIVVKAKKLSSAYFINDDKPGDKDGDTYINTKKLP